MKGELDGFEKRMKTKRKKKKTKDQNKQESITIRH